MRSQPHIQNKQRRRPPRLNFIFTKRSRPVFFITICTRDRKPLLNNSHCHEIFQSFCKASPQQAQVWIGRYVLMPDHLHVFVSAEGTKTLIRWVSSLKRHMTRILKDGNIKESIWQQGFFDHILRDEESYGDKWKYVWQNPVRAGLVDDADAWPYAGEIHRIEW